MNVKMNYFLSVKGVKYYVEIYNYIKGTKIKIKKGLEDGWLFKYFNDEDEMTCAQRCFIGSNNERYFDTPIFKVKVVPE